MELNQKIEGYLFYLAEEISIANLALFFNVEKSEIENELNILQNKLENRGIILVRSNDLVSLRAISEIGLLINQNSETEKVEKLTQSAQEILSIILYLNKTKRQDIDFIRGVNSTYSLRNLISRGLIEKNSKNEYYPTTELFSFLGIGKLEDIENFAEVNKKLNDFLARDEKNGESEN